MNYPEPKLIAGDMARDARGSVAFVNAFQFEGVKRFYVIDNASVGVPRAWHGHWKEEKYVFVAAGRAVICAADMRTGRVLRFEMSAQEPSVLHIPAGWANGSMALESSTKIIHFSTVTLAESEKDDTRYPINAFSDVWYGEEAMKVKA